MPFFSPDTDTPAPLDTGLSKECVIQEEISSRHEIVIAGSSLRFSIPYNKSQLTMPDSFIVIELTSDLLFLVVAEPW